MPTPFVPDGLRQRPFTLDHANTAGLSRRALDSSPWRRLFCGVWVHADVEETREVRLFAARLLIPQYGVLCGLTAAWVHGVDVRREDDLDVHVGFPKGKRIRKRPGVAVCQETLDDSDWIVMDGTRVTTPLRTTFDCLRLLKGAERLVVADAMTHAGLVTIAELSAYFSSKHRLRNLRIGEGLIDKIEPKSESPMETRLRMLIVDAGMPRPEAQHEIHTASGAFVARADLAYPDLKLAIEYDGAWHWKRRRQDDRRRAAMRAVGWEVLVYDADDVYGAPARLIAEVAAARRGRRRAG